MGEPWELSATEAIRLMRAGQLSPVELMESTIERAEAVEPTVNAFAETRYEEAMAAAGAAAARYATGARTRRLEGLPIALKEEVEVRGWSLKWGSLAFVDQMAERTSPLADRIRRSGAIVHARTTTPEFSCVGVTHSKLWGITRNPWDPDFGVGGSSGGSGASLAAGTAPLASGSDIGGSIRLPASANGVVGFKPPHGRVPVGTPFNLDRYCHEGPMARTVADCALFENVLSGPHPADVTTLRPKLRIPAELAGIEGWRIGVSVDLGAYDVDPQIAENTSAAAGALERAGAIVEEVDIGWTLGELAAVSRAHYGAIFGALIARSVEDHRELLCDYTLAWAEEATAAASIPGGFLAGLEAEAELYRPLGRLLRRYRAIVCPTWSIPGTPAGDPWLGTTELGGGGLDRQFEAMMTVPFNIFSACPVLAIPSGFVTQGIPTGVQIVGRTYDDVGVFRIGAALERVRPWPTISSVGAPLRGG
jgi:Asp-tRNA(Asn)/Glu-tRNA(Gln) amidotransferase A subunit family amidase